jgi:FkbM family methyltransferase
MSIYYKIRKYIKFPIPIFFKKYFKKYYGKNKLDQQLEKYLDFHNGFFIELGAYDGVTQSNTLFYERNKGWRGILIEPSKDIYKKCKKNRSIKNFIYNYACVSFDYKEKYIELQFSGLKTYSAKYLGKKKTKEYISQPELEWGKKSFLYKVKVRTLNSILDQSKAPNEIDFLSIDTEGAEFEVIAGINFEKYKFRYMLVETNDLSKLKKFLASKYYKYVKKFNDNDYLFQLASK